MQWQEWLTLSSQAQVLAAGFWITEGVADETLTIVEMFKVRMQGQYGAETDKRLRTVVSEMWKDWGFRKGIMRGCWVSCVMAKLKFLIRLTDLG